MEQEKDYRYVWDVSYVSFHISDGAVTHILSLEAEKKVEKFREHWVHM